MQTSLACLAALGALALAPQRADACSCAPVEPIISPANGAKNVPTDAAIIVSNRLGEPRVELSKGDLSIPLTIEPHRRVTDVGAYVIARPAALEPDTTYVVTITWEYGVTKTRFTTGTSCDHAPAEFAGLASMSPEVMAYPVFREGRPCLDPCVEHTDHVSRLRLAYDRPKDAALVALTLKREDGTLVDEIALPEGQDTLGFTTCEVRSPVLDDDTTYCATVTAYDVSGRALGGDVEVCASTATCAPKLPEYGCMPSDACDAPPVASADSDGEAMPERTAAPAESGGCSSTTAAGGTLTLLSILVPALVPRRRRR